MSDDARPLIDNPYRASHTPIIAGDVNVTDLMARAWDRGFAAGDERLRSDFQSAVSPDERLREALAFYADKGNYTAQNPVGSGAHVWRDMGGRARAALAAADREKPEGPNFCSAAHLPGLYCPSCHRTPPVPDGLKESRDA